MLQLQVYTYFPLEEFSYTQCITSGQKNHFILDQRSVQINFCHAEVLHTQKKQPYFFLCYNLWIKRSIAALTRPFFSIHVLQKFGLPVTLNHVYYFITILINLGRHSSLPLTKAALSSYLFQGNNKFWNVMNLGANIVIYFSLPMVEMTCLKIEINFCLFLLKSKQPDLLLLILPCAREII